MLRWRSWLRERRAKPHHSSKDNVLAPQVAGLGPLRRGCPSLPHCRSCASSRHTCPAYSCVLLNVLNGTVVPAAASVHVVRLASGH